MDRIIELKHEKELSLEIQIDSYRTELLEELSKLQIKVTLLSENLVSPLWHLYKNLTIYELYGEIDLLASGEYQFHIGIIYDTNHNTVVAKEHYHKSHKLGYIDAVNRIGILELNNKNIIEASKYFNIAFRNNNLSMAQIFFDELIKNDMINDVLFYLEIFFEKTNNIEYLHELISVSFINNRIDRTIQYYEKLITLKPDDPLVYEKIGEFYHNILHDHTTALKYLEKALELYGYHNVSTVQSDSVTSNILIQLSSVHREMRNIDKMFFYLQRAADMKNVASIITFADQCFIHGRLDQSIKYYNLAADLENENAITRLICLYWHQENMKLVYSAINDLAKYEKNIDNCWKHDHYLGCYFAFNKDLPRAINLLKTCITKIPIFIRDSYQQKIEQIQSASNEILIFLYIGELSKIVKQYDLEMIFYMYAEKKGSTIAIYKIGNLYSEAEIFDRAIEYYEKYIMSNSIESVKEQFYIDTLQKIINILKEKNDPESAINLCMISIKNGCVKANLFLADLLKCFRPSEDILPHLKNALTGGIQEAYLHLGFYYYSQKEFTKSREFFLSGEYWTSEESIEYIYDTYIYDGLYDDIYIFIYTIIEKNLELGKKFFSENICKDIFATNNYLKTIQYMNKNVIPFNIDHECALCMGEINDRVVLKCKHSYCKSCLVNLLLSNFNYRCPLCKNVIL